jgi:cation diffusion facilitator CzcD-associated flavoprotein CzcO
VPFTCYEFPEFPWPDDLIDSEYPSGAAVKRYINAYAEYFGLLPHVR